MLFAIAFGGGSNGAAEQSPQTRSVQTYPPARIAPLGSVTRPTATPYSETASIEDGRDNRSAPGSLGEGAIWLLTHPAPALPLSIEARICAMPWLCAEALAVAWCESRYDPAAYNAAGPYIGVFQIDPALHGWRAGGASLYDVSTNVRVAFAVYQDAGDWTPWPNCRP